MVKVQIKSPDLYPFIALKIYQKTSYTKFISFFESFSLANTINNSNFKPLNNTNRKLTTELYE